MHKSNDTIINYTIIIPHKNIPELLQRCLDSIPFREDVQIIIVDDNSDANKVDFANFPGLNKPHVEIIFDKNINGRKGAGYARNIGLEKAIGKWLIFADADDYFTDCFNELLDYYVDDKNNDIVYFKVTSADSETLQTANRHESIIRVLDSVKQTKQFDLLLKLSVPYGKFIKMSLVKNNNILFKEYNWSNDVMFSVKCCIFASTITISDSIAYCVTVRDGSLMYSHTLESMKTRFYSNYESVVFIKKYNKKEKKEFILLDWWSLIYNVNKIAAVVLLPKMLYACGFKFVYKKIVKPYLINKYKIFYE